MAASGTQAAGLAGEIGDGLISTSPDRELAETFANAGGQGKPRYAELGVCWAADEAQARRTAFEYWPISGLQGELTAELATPAHFEQACALVTEEKVAESVICGPDPERHLAKIREYLDAGYDHVWVHQIGPEQEGFFGFYEREILPKLR